MSETRVIHCWSGPRCCSTSLMYSWAQRRDTKVLDEPLYASYLHRTGLQHPGRDEILALGNTDGDQVLQNEIYADHSRPVLYCKHIGKHKLAVSSSVFDRDEHLLLIREPAGVIQSWNKVAEPTMQELGYTALLEIISELRSRGKPVRLILSDELVRHPEAVLRSTCSALNLEFDPAMLSWPPGPKPYDGVWWPHWYTGTHKSTGFAGSLSEGRSEPLDAKLRPLYQECSALYALMCNLALRPTSHQVPRSLPDAPAPDAVHAPPGPSHHLDSSGNQKHSSQGAARGTHAFVADPRNADVLIGMRDGVTGVFDLVWRPQAKVSVFDSGFMLGDGVWEGIRLHKGVLVEIQAHLDRLYQGAKALDMDLACTKTQLQELMYRTVDANGMSTASGVHIRLMVSRGLKPTPYQSPYITIGHPTIVIIPEYKEALPGPTEQGITLFTCHVRRGAPDVQDPGWNSHSKLNCIAACIQAKKAGVDEALMLDPHGFVATCNSVNFFIVHKGEVWAPTTKYQLQGITRGAVLHLCGEHGITARELDFSLTQVYSADEAFVTGTFGGITPVRMVDGRLIGNGERGRITCLLQQLYLAQREKHADAGRQPQLS